MYNTIKQQTFIEYWEGIQGKIQSGDVLYMEGRVEQKKEKELLNKVNALIQEARLIQDDPDRDPVLALSVAIQIACGWGERLKELTS